VNAPTLAVHTDAVLRTLQEWSDSGLLRQLDSAFAAFVAGLDADATPALLVSTALLVQMEGRGHSCLPLSHLVAEPGAFLSWPEPEQPALDALWSTLPATLEGWIQALQYSPVVHKAGANEDRGQPLVLDAAGSAPRLYLRRYWNYERRIEAAVRQRSTALHPVDEARARTWLDRFFAPGQPGAESHGDAMDWQKLACAIALRGRLSIITGGPGTGKTYTAARLLALLFATSPDPERMRVVLAAPTGKAATRLKQSLDGSLHSLQAGLGAEFDFTLLTQRIGAARTLHSLLGASADTRRFRHHAGNPLDVDVVIVDEASMVHLEMMSALFDALPADARLILLGDKDQLASVEAGAVLGDLCRDAHLGQYDQKTASYAASVTGQHLPADYLAHEESAPALAQQIVMLRKSRRFDGPIGALAAAVNDASDPELPLRLLKSDDTAVLHAEEGSPVSTAIAIAAGGRPGAKASYRDYLKVLAERPRGDDPDEHAQWVHAVLAEFDRFRVLCAVREGAWGVSGLNRALEQTFAAKRLLNPKGTWYVGRPVIITRNDAALGVVNGDIGICLPTPGPDSRLRVFLADGDKLRSVAVNRLTHAETAFAMTVHKSQGSEFEHTMLVLSGHSGSLLSRELVYTGITRARTAFTLLSEVSGILAQAVARPTRRESGLRC
jgi:exodeoxyribonuclease V alpha subunit